MPRSPERGDSEGNLDIAADIAAALGGLGFDPILIGGMALVILGSRRVTRDYDFVIAQPAGRVTDLVRAFYDREFELASRVSAEGDVTATIDNAKVAALRLRLDAPASAYFYSRERHLRVDLLFDFPIPAAELAASATRMKIGSHVFHVASESDLLRLKKIARKRRSFAGDAQDIEFLEARQKRGR